MASIDLPMQKIALKKGVDCMLDPLDGANIWQNVEQNVHTYSNCMDGRRQSTKKNLFGVEFTKYHGGTSCRIVSVQLN